METLLWASVLLGGGYIFGWTRGSQAGFKKAVDQLERIIRIVERRK